MICWIVWPQRKRETEAEGPSSLDLVEQVRGLEARLARVLADRQAKRMRTDADAALRALTPTEHKHDDHDDA